MTRSDTPPNGPVSVISAPITSTNPSMPPFRSAHITPTSTSCTNRSSTPTGTGGRPVIGHSKTVPSHKSNSADPAPPGYKEKMLHSPTARASATEIRVTDKVALAEQAAIVLRVLPPDHVMQLIENFDSEVATPPSVFDILMAVAILFDSKCRPHFSSIKELVLQPDLPQRLATFDKNAMNEHTKLRLHKFIKSNVMPTMDRRLQQRFPALATLFEFVTGIDMYHTTLRHSSRRMELRKITAHRSGKMGSTSSSMTSSVTSSSGGGSESVKENRPPSHFHSKAEKLSEDGMDDTIKSTDSGTMSSSGGTLAPTVPSNGGSVSQQQPPARRPVSPLSVSASIPPATASSHNEPPTHPFPSSMTDTSLDSSDPPLSPTEPIIPTVSSGVSSGSVPRSAALGGYAAPGAGDSGNGAAGSNVLLSNLCRNNTPVSTTDRKSSTEQPAPAFSLEQKFREVRNLQLSSLHSTRSSPSTAEGASSFSAATTAAAAAPSPTPTSSYQQLAASIAQRGSSGLVAPAVAGSSAAPRTVSPVSAAASVGLYPTGVMGQQQQPLPPASSYAPPTRFASSNVSSVNGGAESPDLWRFNSTPPTVGSSSTHTSSSGSTVTSTNSSATATSTKGRKKVRFGEIFTTEFDKMEEVACRNTVFWEAIQAKMREAYKQQTSFKEYTAASGVDWWWLWKEEYDEHEDKLVAPRVWDYVFDRDPKGFKS